MAYPVYSRDIWDYLGDMPYMPKRADRDALVERARRNPEDVRRVRLWDFFFRINPEDVGIPQRREIETLTRQRLADLAAAEARHRATVVAVGKMLLAGLGFVGLSLMLSLLAGWEWLTPVVKNCSLGSINCLTLCHSIWLPAPLLAVLGFGLYRRSRARWQATRAQIEAAYTARVAQLQKMMAALRRRIPRPPSDAEVHQWLNDDLARLVQVAQERTGLELRLIPLENAPNPVCFLGPAELQSRIPTPLTQDDRALHLVARRLVSLPNDKFEDVYGVYYVQFILVAGDMLGDYGCFFDFVTGLDTNERTSEQYYNDVVALSTRKEYRLVRVGQHQIPIENAPTFAMILASGNEIEVTFASYEYFIGLHKQIGDQFSPPGPEFWSHNPELIAEAAIKALRHNLRQHKGL